MPWATFDRVKKLYRFDRELRIITLDAIERIEIAVRCRIVYEYCTRYDGHWYEDKSCYTRDYGKIMKKVREELGRSKELFISHYYSKYTSPAHPPAWMAIEVLSFGTLSWMSKSLQSNDAKKAVANHFGVSVSILESWIEHLAYVRNICAHHSRLWNRTMTFTATLPKNPHNEWITIPSTKPNKAYSTLCIIAYLIKIIAPHSYFKGKLKTLIVRLPQIDIKAAGFPKDWQNDKFWKGIHIGFTYRLRVAFFKLRNAIFQK